MILEGNMALFDKLLGLKLIGEDDLTDTTWWEKTVFHGLASDESDNQPEDENSEPASELRPGPLN